AQDRHQPCSHRCPVSPEQVVSKAKHSLGVDEARHADADANYRTDIGVDAADQLRCQSGECRQQVGTLRRSVDAMLGEHLTRGGNQECQHLGATDVDAEPNGSRWPGDEVEVRTHRVDSTLAFRSRIAAWMMLPSARRLMNPGNGTRSSIASS